MSELKKIEEAQYYDQITRLRLNTGLIPLEADRQTKSFQVPTHKDGVVIDAKMNEILDNGFLNKVFKELGKKKCKILDVCCGLGWLSLELARRGHSVTAYDLSEKSIKYAREILEINKNKNGFGKIEYINQDVTKRVFQKDEFDAIIGWSAFHHIPEINNFLDICSYSLKNNGLIVAYDDYERGNVEKFLLNFTRFVLPQIGYTTKEKIKYLINPNIFFKKWNEPTNSPMEEAAQKTSAVEEIDNYFEQNFNIIKVKTRNGFCGTPLMRMKNVRLRYLIAKVLNAIDNFLITLKLAKGFDRIIIARKSLK